MKKYLNIISQKNLIKITIILVFSTIGFLLGKLYKPVLDITKYKKIIYENANSFSLEPELIQAIIITESGGNPGAVSYKKAFGLMQVMPDTGKEIAKKLKIKIINNRCFVKPEINIKIGCYYIYSLMKKFNGDIILVLSAYNTGPNRVKRWLEEYPNFSSKDIVEIKAGQETQEYIYRVLKLYDKYKK